MARLEDNNGIEVAYAYNADGLRVRKTVNGISNGVVVDSTLTEYTLHGKQVVHVKQGDENLHFFYDAKGRPAVVQWGGMKYGYVHNLQGDIVAIIDGSGNAVVEYTYDAWGSPLTKTGALAASLGTLNPFRYRGYVYDDETGLYYLRSRYYNPMWGRFLNADTVLGFAGRLLDHNAFAYCRNCVITSFDPSGHVVDDAGGGISQTDYKYIRVAIQSKKLLKQMESSVLVDGNKGWIGISNNTEAALKYFDLAGYSASDYFFDHDWAMEIAQMAVAKYEKETGMNYHLQTGIETEKVAYEVRVHVQLYLAGFAVSHTDRTDVSPSEGDGWIIPIHVQDWIDLFYSIGSR